MKREQLANWLLEENLVIADKTLKESKEVEVESDEIEVDVDKLIKLVEKVCAHAEKTEDEKLEKICDEFKKILGMEDELEEAALTADQLKEKVVKAVTDRFKDSAKTAKELDTALKIALYFYAMEYHAGQKDNWFEIMKALKYDPKDAKDVKEVDNWLATEIFEFLEKKFGKK